MARRTIWQGIIDWFTPGARHDRAGSSPSDEPSGGGPPATDAYDRRAAIDRRAPLDRRVASASAPKPSLISTPVGASSPVSAPEPAGEWPSNVVPFPDRGVRDTSSESGTHEEIAGVAIADAGGVVALDPGFEPGLDESELLDFMAADVDPVPADPSFRERLREELWELVVEEGVAAAIPHDGDPASRQKPPPRRR